MSNSKYLCPECNSPIIAWADLDAEMSFKVNSNGTLTRNTITNSYQSDGRSGVRCSKCDWDLHGNDMTEEDSHLQVLATQAYENQKKIELLAPKIVK